MKYRLWACLLFLPMVLWASGRPKVAVVLSGGGAKGTAHIGALKVIEEAGIPIDYVVGTSMGAIVGGLYSIGEESEVRPKNEKYEEINHYHYRCYSSSRHLGCNRL